MAIARSLYEYVNSSLDFVGNLDLDIRNKISDIALQEDIVDDSAPIEPIDTRQIEPELMEQAQQLFPKLQKLTFDQVITIIGILLTICNLLYMDAQTKQVHVDAVQQHEDSVQAHADAERAHQDFLDSLNQSTKVDTKIKTTPENPR